MTYLLPAVQVRVIYRLRLKSVQSILKSGQDKLPSEETVQSKDETKQHRFTRGAEYYKRGK